jgi:hypothetical protein
MNKTASESTYTLNNGTRRVQVRGTPRRISGGYIVTVCWATDDVTQLLRDGSVHPAHRAGFSWEEPILNINGYRP